MGLYVTILSSIYYKFQKHDKNGTNSWGMDLEEYIKFT